MTSRCSDELEPHREGDRALDVTDEPEQWAEFWDAPTFEKWRRGGDPWR
jgi:hypothetical protein